MKRAVVIIGAIILGYLLLTCIWDLYGYYDKSRKEQVKNDKKANIKKILTNYESQVITCYNNNRSSFRRINALSANLQNYYQFDAIILDKINDEINLTFLLDSQSREKYVFKAPYSQISYNPTDSESKEDKRVVDGFSKDARLLEILHLALQVNVDLVVLGPSEDGFQVVRDNNGYGSYGLLMTHNDTLEEVDQRHKVIRKIDQSVYFYRDSPLLIL